MEESNDNIQLQLIQAPKLVVTPETVSISALESESAPESKQEPKLAETQAQAPEPKQENLPCQDLLSDERRRDFIDTCVPLYEAFNKGDWGAAEAILLNNRDLVRYSITSHCDTALHVAASAQSIKFVQHLVNMMSVNDLQLQNRSGNTALCLAAIAGNVKIARIMVEINEYLLTIPNSKGMTPLFLAALYRNHDMVNYLYDKSPLLNAHGWTPTQKGRLYLKCVEVDLFDMALKIFRDHTDIPHRETALGVLAQKYSAFDEIKPHVIRRIINSIISFKVGPATKESQAMELLREIWTSIEEKPKTEIDRILRGPQTMINESPTNPSQVLFVATEMGNTNFVVELIRKYPDIIWMKNDNNQSIFHIAVSHRRAGIYNLLYEIGSTKAFITSLKDTEGNNMLHLAAKKAGNNQPQDVSGVAFQLQRELLWFKEVESIVPPHYKHKKNNDGDTPQELLFKTHKATIPEAEKWMKATASQCMVVATLIATIVFQVAFTLPGGDNQSTGFPIFLLDGPFIAFVIFDALSVVLSSTSILIFLSILTSRYAQEDFIESLPTKLMAGLATLFLSIVTMMMAFGVSFFVLYRKDYTGLPALIFALATIPIISYNKLQNSLLKEVFQLTFSSRYIFKPKKRLLYH